VPEAPPSDRLLYAGPGGLRVGSFRRYPWQVPFRDTGPIHAFLMVFPRTSVVIQHAGRAPVVADPTRVILYNRGQEYTRRALSERGDACEWFATPPELVAAAIRPHDPSVEDRLDRPYTWTHGAVDAATYLLQRRVVEHLRSGEPTDPLFVEESMMRLLERCATPPEAPATASPRKETTAGDHREIAEACRVVLAKSLGERLSLGELASRVGASPFHLARIFRKDSGLTIHSYLHQLRLRTALERIMDKEDLSRVAMDLGYATHSHFTAFFRRAFGAPPSAVRTASRSLTPHLVPRARPVPRAGS
jgi:AraC family transcriptional regulator